MPVAIKDLHLGPLPLTTLFSCFLCGNPVELLYACWRFGRCCESEPLCLSCNKILDQAWQDYTRHSEVCTGALIS